jgi:hypothetical protein
MQNLAKLYIHTILQLIFEFFDGAQLARAPPYCGSLAGAPRRAPIEKVVPSTLAVKYDFHDR